MQSEVVPRPARVAGRFDALDSLRFLAVVFMIQGHTFTLVMHPSVREEAWYRWHNYLHGFTAPAFMFGAGLAFGVTTFRNLQAHLTMGVALRKRLWRYASLLILGYTLQLPPLGAGFTQLSEQRLKLFFRVDALHIIGISLLICQLLILLLRTRARIATAAFAVGSAVVLSAPLLSRLPVESSVPLAVAGYLTSHTGSPFPLFPWGGFIFLGIAIGGLIPRDAMAGPNLRLGLGLWTGGLAMVLASVWFDAHLPDVFGEHFYWKDSPYFFLRRLGWVVCLLGTLSLSDYALRALHRRAGRAQGARRVQAAASSRVRDFIQLVGQNSLIVYVAHLLVLYGTPYTRSVHSVAADKLSLLEASTLAALLAAAMITLLFAWQRLDRTVPQGFATFRRVSLAALGAVCLTCATGIAIGRARTPSDLAQAPARPAAAQAPRTPQPPAAIRAARVTVAQTPASQTRLRPAVATAPAASVGTVAIAD